VEELRQRPVLALDAEGDPLLIAPLLERSTRDVEADRMAALRRGRLDDQFLLLDIGVPREVGLAVPLGVLGLFVELVQLRLGTLLVVLSEDRVALRRDDMATVRLLGTDDGENGLQVVDVLAADDVLGAAHLCCHVGVSLN
jgi:hypothetical protein